MPGRFFLTRPISEIAALLGVSGDVPDQPARRNIQPGQEMLVLNQTRLVPMRWGMIPVGRVNARGRPVMETIFNARSETVFDKTAFEGVGRAVVPVDGWYEWTGEKRRKTAWRISSADGAPLYFAAITDIWQAPGGLQVDQFAAVTCEPNGDVKPIHHRMGVLLKASDIVTWLTGSEKQAQELTRPWPDGLLHIQEAKDVDWSAP
ncbi:SOS response-associated peptidase [Ruegeria sp.]|uniref:SOS response-associated peptidase n=1 Tax=Ruegeria sp. TaxID=1879320 RepID=UPI003B5AFA29